MSDEPASIWPVVVAGAVALATGGLSAFVTWLVAQRPGKAAEVTSDAAWQTAMNDGFAKLNAAQELRNQALETEVAELKTAVTQLVQTGRAFAQHVESLEAVLAKAGVIDIPPRPIEAVWPPKDFQVLTGGKS